MIMGANVGTSLTSTLVSLTQAADGKKFELAFAGATVHDCFNWLTVISLLTLETCTGYLYNLTLWLTSQMNLSSESGEVSRTAKINILGALTKPVTSRVVQVRRLSCSRRSKKLLKPLSFQIEKRIIKCWSLGGCQEERLLRVWCNGTNDVTAEEEVRGRVPEAYNMTNDVLGSFQAHHCSFLMNIDGLSDLGVGLILLIASLIILTVCLILIVKVLDSLLKGE